MIVITSYFKKLLIKNLSFHALNLYKYLVKNIRNQEIRKVNVG